MINYPTNISFVSSLSSKKRTSTYNEATLDERWKEATSKEIQALELNKTWEIVDSPEIKFLLDVNGTIKIKYRVDGSIERFKA